MVLLIQRRWHVRACERACVCVFARQKCCESSARRLAFFSFAFVIAIVVVVAVVSFRLGCVCASAHLLFSACFFFLSLLCFGSPAPAYKSEFMCADEFYLWSVRAESRRVFERHLFPHNHCVFESKHKTTKLFSNTFASIPISNPITRTHTAQRAEFSALRNRPSLEFRFWFWFFFYVSVS